MGDSAVHAIRPTGDPAWAFFPSFEGKIIKKTVIYAVYCVNESLVFRHRTELTLIFAGQELI